MPITSAQLLDLPGGPGDTGAVKSGSGVNIATDGTVSCPGGGGTTAGVFQVVAGSNMSVNNGGIGDVTISYIGPGPSPPFPGGTRVVINNASAPTGWSTVNIDNAAIRIVSSNGGSTGGSVNFTDVYTTKSTSGSTNAASANSSQGTSTNADLSPSGNISFANTGWQATTINESQNAAHAHFVTGGQYSGGGERGAGMVTTNNTFQIIPVPGPAVTMTTAGSNQSHNHFGRASDIGLNCNAFGHTHTAVGSASVPVGTFTGSSIDLRIQYLDSLVIQKN